MVWSMAWQSHKLTGLFFVEVEILRIFVWEHNWKRPLLVGTFDAGLKYFVDVGGLPAERIHQYPPSLPCAPWNPGFSMVIWPTRTSKIRNTITALKVQYCPDLRYLFGLGLLSSSAMVCYANSYIQTASSLSTSHKSLAEAGYPMRASSLIVFWLGLPREMRNSPPPFKWPYARVTGVFSTPFPRSYSPS